MTGSVLTVVMPGAGRDVVQSTLHYTTLTDSWLTDISSGANAFIIAGQCGCFNQIVAVMVQMVQGINKTQKEPRCTITYELGWRG